MRAHGNAHRALSLAEAVCGRRYQHVLPGMQRDAANTFARTHMDQIQESYGRITKIVADGQAAAAAPSESVAPLSASVPSPSESGAPLGREYCGA